MYRRWGLFLEDFLHPRGFNTHFGQSTHTAQIHSCCELRMILKFVLDGDGDSLSNLSIQLIWRCALLVILDLSLAG